MNMALAAICVILFSFTVPATRIATLAFAPEAVALLRLIGAGLICMMTVIVFDRWVPPRRAWLSIAATAFGAVAGFSFLTALAMKRVPATHGAVALTALPAMTAIYASLRDRANPGIRFWVFCSAGTALAFASFAARSGASVLPGDWILGAAVLSAAFGYVEGGRLSREHGGRRVMSWAVILPLPIALFLAVSFLRTSTLPSWEDAPSAWMAAAYLAVVSQSLGMFLWFKVLARGPMGKIAMIQLIQPFFSLLAAVFILKEPAGWETWVVASLVGLTIFGANREKENAVKAT